MNQSGKKNKKLTIPEKFDIPAKMKEIEDDFRMSLGLTAAINVEKRRLLSKTSEKSGEEK